MSIELFNTYDVCSFYLSALWYGDYSACSIEEIKFINEFIEDLPDEHTLDATGIETYFAMDKISGQMADCVELRVYAPTEQSTH